MCAHTCDGGDKEGSSESEPQGQGCTQGGCSCCQLLRSVKLIECDHQGRKVKGGKKKKRKKITGGSSFLTCA